MNDKIKDLTGEKFGRLLVLYYDGQDKNRRSVWMCKCTCGSYVRVPRNRLTSGNTTSCGCYNREIVSLPPTDSGINRILHSYKNGAHKRGIDFKLSKKQFSNIIFSDCHYCGSSPSSYHKHQYHGGGILYNGIDRIDSNQGYEDGNVVACCSDCNYAKRKMNIQQFTNWIDKISKSSFFLLQKFGGRFCTFVR
jgi:hypothetical protein